MSDARPSIVVAGDVCIDWFAIPVPRVIEPIDPPAGGLANWRLREGLRMFARPGGAWLLADLVSSAAGQSVLRQPVPTPLEHQTCDDALHSMVELSAHPLSNTEKSRKERASYVWRVERFRGFSGPTSGTCQHCMTPVQNDSKDARLVVIDDVGNGFRERQEAWPDALRRESDGPLVLWKLARPLEGGSLAKHLLEKLAHRTILVLDVDDLRAAGATINRHLSWERTAGDLIRALTHDRRFSELRKVKHLVVRLDLEGAVQFTPGTDQPGDETTVDLTYLPSGIEGSTRAEVPGDMMGLGGVFVAMIAAELARAGSGSLAERVRTGIQTGIAASRELFRAGFGLSTSEPTTLNTALAPNAKAVAEFVTVNVAPLAGRDPASRLLDYVRRAPLERLAEQIIVQGIDSATPRAPVARFGELETLDRSEMETYRSIRNLIGEYLAQVNPERPLSIAVFGPPGSGKSFGVEQVAKSLGAVEKIGFNVSQFDGARQLTAAFHVVRDAVVRGRVPLVFFDEFDAAPNGQSLGWLKYFLAPMQDGKFLDGESTHLIGRALFIFAGGTKPTFTEFAQLKEKDFINQKGPDFVSRLRGVMNVRGTDRREPNDELHVVRRAVLLRSMFQRKAPALFNAAGSLRVDPGVRRAFLRCGSFLHGARSMESIIDMSLLSGRETFEPASLPAPRQLDLHLDAEEFMELVNQDVHLSELREPLAQAIHARFVAEQTGKKPADDPAMQPWDSLPGNYREDNREQADDISRKLALVNCACRAFKPGSAHAAFEFSPQEIEVMAEAEHERWNDSKRVQGYSYAPERRDEAPKTHPCLLPWSDLPRKEKDKDRDTVKAIPTFLQAVGFEVFRLF